MPDFTIETHWVCQDLDYYEERIGSSSVKKEAYNVTCYRGEWNCTCQGFRFRKTCRHVKQAEKNRCTWNQYVDGGEPKVIDNGTEKIRVCPKCGRPCIPIRYAV